MPPRIAPTAINTVPSGSVLCAKKGLLELLGTVTVGVACTDEEVVESVGNPVAVVVAELSLLVLEAVITIAE